jgi:hypothetical protein
VATTGSLIVKKTLTDDTPIPLPANTPFPMTVTCSPPPFSVSFSLTANGSYTVNNIPSGSTCTVVEIPPALPANLCRPPAVPMWVPSLPTYTPASVVITNGTTATIIVHNSVQCVPKRDGTLSVTKVVNPDPLNIGTTKAFPMTVTCTPSPPSYTVTVNGNTSTLPIAVPVGSHCTVSEGTMPSLPPGCHWLAPAYSPASVIIASGLNQETVTNGYRCEIMTPPKVCPPPLVANVDGICGCPPGTVERGKECVRPIVCRPPLVSNAAGTDCVCRDGLVLRNGKCVEVTQPKREQTCKRGYVWNGDMCVKRRAEPGREEPRERPGIGFPGRVPGLGGGGGGGTPGKR